MAVRGGVPAERSDPVEPPPESASFQSQPSLALLGSGEFLAWTEPVDRWLLERARNPDGPVLVLPTASAPEGDDVFDRWSRMGLDHYRRLGVRVDVLPLKTRHDADRPELAARLESASMVFFSGGNPAYLAETLAGTRFWTTFLVAMADGLAYAGCSAGIACLGGLALDSSLIRLGSDRIWRTGLNLLPRVVLGPHWDTAGTYVPGLPERILASVPEGWRLLVVDERTAIVGDGSEWQLIGTGGAGMYEDRKWQTWNSGESFRTQLLAAPSAR